jgi:multidrug resistance efflux pump
MTDSKLQISVPTRAVRGIVTAAVVIVAVLVAWIAFSRFQTHPWTRDGMIRADVVGVATYVSGKVVAVHVSREQLVEEGQLLFEIDPASYQLAVAQAEVALDEARQQVAALEASVEAARAGVEVSRTAIQSAEGDVESARARVTSAVQSVIAAETRVTQADATIAQYQAELEFDRAEAERYARLAETGASSRENAEKTAANLRAAQAGLDSANAQKLGSVAAVAQAEAALIEARAGLIISENGVREAESSLAASIAALTEAEATLGVPGEDNVRVRAAKASLANAELNLERTVVRAPTSGWVTNLFLQPGQFAQPGVAMISLVDRDSLRVSAFFKETQLFHIKPGDRVTITQMGNSRRPLEGVVESIGRAINPPQIASGLDGSSAAVPSIAPTYDWIRLAQRVPVIVRFEEIPDDVVLVSGTTVSVAVDPSR